MKKIFAVLAVLVLLLLLPCHVLASGSASMSGPSTVRAGDTIRVSFYAGGGIYGGSGAVSYDSSLLTLQGYTASIGGSWAVEFNGNNFVFYDNSMANPISGSTIFTATFKVSDSVQEGTKIVVSATNVTLSDGTSDSHVGTTSYSATILPPLSDNANLKSLTVSNASISPAFSPSVTNYSASVPFTTGSLNVSAEAEHPGAKVTVGNTGLTAGGTTNVNITVKAENGTTKTYTIRTKRAQDPNYVPSDENTLTALGVEGFLLSPVFTPECQSYAVYLPNEVESLTVQAQKADNKSSVEVPAISAIPVGQTVYEIPVTAENGTVRTYTLTVFRAEAFGAEPIPTEPPTEPPTEAPAEEPTEAPTELATQPVVPEGSQGVALWLCVLVGVLCFCAGGAAVILWKKWKKKTA